MCFALLLPAVGSYYRYILYFDQKVSLIVGNGSFWALRKQDPQIGKPGWHLGAPLRKFRFRFEYTITRQAVCLPLWPFVIAPGVLAVLLWRNSRPWRPGHCRCGYDLTGNESGKCPECGRAIEIGPLRVEVMTGPWAQSGTIGKAANQLHPKSNACPWCGSTNVRNMSWSERRQFDFTLVVPRVCENCIFAFVPPCGWVTRMAGIIVGILSMGMGVVGFVIVPVVEAQNGHWQVSLLFSMALSMCVLWGSYRILKTSFRSGNPQVLAEGVDKVERPTGDTVNKT